MLTEGKGLIENGVGLGRGRLEPNNRAFQGLIRRRNAKLGVGYPLISPLTPQLSP
jgi:hypothetical protein